MNELRVTDTDLEQTDRLTTPGRVVMPPITIGGDEGLEEDEPAEEPIADTSSEAATADVGPATGHAEAVPADNTAHHIGATATEEEVVAERARAEEVETTDQARRRPSEDQPNTGPDADQAVPAEPTAATEAEPDPDEGAATPTEPPDEPPPTDRDEPTGADEPEDPDHTPPTTGETPDREAIVMEAAGASAADNTDASDAEEAGEATGPVGYVQGEVRWAAQSLTARLRAVSVNIEEHLPEELLPTLEKVLDDDIEQGDIPGQLGIHRETLRSRMHAIIERAVELIPAGGLPDIPESEIERVFGTDLNLRRSGLGLTTQQVADAAGVSEATMSSILTGRGFLPRREVYENTLRALQYTGEEFDSRMAEYDATRAEATKAYIQAMSAKKGGVMEREPQTLGEGLNRRRMEELGETIPVFARRVGYSAPTLGRLFYGTGTVNPQVVFDVMKRGFGATDEEAAAAAARYRESVAPRAGSETVEVGATGAELRGLIKGQKRTIDDLAEATGISAQTISRATRALTFPEPGVIATLYGELGMPAEEIDTRLQRYGGELSARKAAQFAARSERERIKARKLREERARQAEGDEEA